MPQDSEKNTPKGKENQQETAERSSFSEPRMVATVQESETVQEDRIFGLVRANLFFILVGVTTIAFLGMIGQFLITVLWAVVLTMIFYGLFKGVGRRVGEQRRGLAAAITSLLIFFFVIIPFIFLTIALVNQGLDLYQSIEAGEVDPNFVVDYVESQIPGIYDMLGDAGISPNSVRDKISELVGTVSQFVATKVLSFGSNLINVFVQFTLMLLWGVAMTLLALLPVGGSAIVWFPAVIILFAQGYPIKATILLVVGALIIGLVDNLLRPLLVGRDTEMPDYLVLISTLGGITYFGLSGFVIGPTIAALFITVWEMMGRDYGGKSA